MLIRSWGHMGPGPWMHPGHLRALHFPSPTAWSGADQRCSPFTLCPLSDLEAVPGDIPDSSAYFPKFLCSSDRSPSLSTEMCAEQPLSLNMLDTSGTCHTAGLGSGDWTHISASSWAVPSLGGARPWVREQTGHRALLPHESPLPEA